MTNELTDTTDRDGRRTTYSYDSGGRMTAETLGGCLARRGRSPTATTTTTS